MLAERKAIPKLLLLSLLNIAVMVGLAVQKPDESALQKLGHAVRWQVLDDSSAFMQEAWRVERAGLPVYPTVFFQEHLKFQYPTSSLLLGYVAEGLHVSWHTLVKGMVLASWVLTLWFAAEVFLKVLPVQGRERWAVRLSVMSLGLFFYPLILGVRFGQMQTVITFLFTLAVWLWMGERRMATGVCLALACAVKPPLGLFLLWGLLRREWRFVGAFLATVVVVQGVAIACFGWSNEIGYLAPLSYMAHHGECIGENQSVNGLLQRLLRNGQEGTEMFPPYNPMVYFGTVASSVALVVLGLALPVWRRWNDPVRDFLLFGLLSTMASPIVWTHHYGVFYVGCVYFLGISLRETGRVPASFVVCFLLLANFLHLAGRFYWVPSVNWVFSNVLGAGMGITLLLATLTKEKSWEG